MPERSRLSLKTLANLKNHIVPLLGALQASEIERQDIVRLVRDIAQGKTAKDSMANYPSSTGGQ